MVGRLGGPGGGITASGVIILPDPVTTGKRVPGLLPRLSQLCGLPVGRSPWRLRDRFAGRSRCGRGIRDDNSSRKRLKKSRGDAPSPVVATGQEREETE